jgi:organic hydroperoxide reductase OsmC/OhrA
MQEFPHYYSVTVDGSTEGDVHLTSARVPALRSASPAEFDGPGDRWSPETLLVGAVADCFVLTFRGIARASKLRWTSIRCDIVGTLDRIDRVTQFTHFELRASVDVPAGTDAEAVRRVLDKAERGCLIANSLKAAIHLEPEITVAAEPAAALTHA